MGSFGGQFLNLRFVGVYDTWDYFDSQPCNCVLYTELFLGPSKELHEPDVKIRGSLQHPLRNGAFFYNFGVLVDCLYMYRHYLCSYK
jgi:hypothetical protein